MNEIRMGAVEQRFAEIIWQNEPVASGVLVKLCEKQLGWKKSTTYTVLKKLCTKGIFKNENGTVTSVMKKDEYFSVQSTDFVDETFEGSLPAFIAAFTKRKKLSEKELTEIRHLIDSFGEG